ncbi:D-arabinono-1,4-lactone oxidase [Meiothermus granaticius]|uniref:Putative xylitol oxidase n=1 Tax=Meiothermus granaticius NBRC 107808 TaxID=1227551 RepID=A0A399F9S4_9DEIN|nr:D-arabinono-1,4-lactone oxidase [Meiothermus granaticius]MCL6526477.1 FAD-binding protein [Thermaceae bacterium]RIH92900.1 putative xylitol oxidase [Meiothermus granaticius NBRC 107808]GEM86756.1 putative xylitol oxidase [Meiothermus granaticius NBRC 107808]
MGIAETNWAGNLTYSATRLLRPRSLEELQEGVRRSSKLKVLGSRHSFNSIADTSGELLSLEAMPPEVSINPQERTVTVNAWMRYGELALPLEAAGYALFNLASLPHISLIGACATATHGSGDTNPSLASAVRALEMVLADGSVVWLRRGQDWAFEGAVVGLGALGVVTRLTLDLVPSFALRQRVYLDLPFSQLEQHFEAITSSAYSLSLFTDWRGRRFAQVWRKSLADSAPAEPIWFGAKAATEPLHMLPGCPPQNTTPQLDVPGPWLERLPHFRLGHTPSNGEELQSEYLVPRQHALEAMGALFELGDQIAPVLQTSEVRTIAADHLWMSPYYQQPCVGLHFTWVKDWPAVREVLPRIEAQLRPFSPRPHWGKLFTLPPEALGPLYPRLPEFQRLMKTYDPEGKFQNAFLEQTLRGMH